jgi:hypothetical protein
MSDRFSFSLVAQVVPGILVVLIGYLGCDIIFVLIVWFVAVTLITAGYAGAMANIVDIAPNFAGECSMHSMHFMRLARFPGNSEFIVRDGNFQDQYWHSHRQFT